MRKKAFFWIVTREYFEEAARSAISALEHNPGIDRFVISPDTDRGVPVIFNLYITVPPQRGPFWYVDSTRYFSAALKAMTEDYSHLIYLDSDTKVLHPFKDLWMLLTKFDLAGSHAPGRRTRPTFSYVPPSFPELNIGVLAMQNTDRLRKTFRDWLSHYEEYAIFYGNNDQAPLREILWHNKRKLPFYIFPPEYNFRFGFGGWVRNQVHVLHGRSPNLDKIAHQVNNPGGFRGWKPGELP